MRLKIDLNSKWQFHLGNLTREPNKLSKKAYALGGFTQSLLAEHQPLLPISPGGKHFLKLIAQGDEKQGLVNLCGTDLESDLDESWQEVELPHDWKVTLPYVNNPAKLMAGSKEDGVAYYRKRFVLAEDHREQKLVLHFKGIMGEADFWFNGAYLGHNHSGYTEVEFDISGLAYFEAEGSNTLLVKVDTSQGNEGWWYDGAGIYKDVYLECLPALHLVADDFYVYTQSISGKMAQLSLQYGLQNDTRHEQEVTVTYTVAGIKGQVSRVIPPLTNKVFHEKLTLTEVQAWSPEKPHLYKAKLSIAGDELVKEFGIRTFNYTNKGFYLNGSRYELKGICEHQDFAGVGVALNQDIVDFKVKKMKEMGVNAWRSAHHFASEELLTACDRLGIILIDENRLPEASPWRLADFKKMIKKARMHACLAFWSLGNEELVGNTEFGSRSLAKFAAVVKKYDQESLLISAELLSPEGFVAADYLENFDVLGINYPEAGVMGAGAELIRQQHPQLAIMSTENASYFSTRGAYRDDAAKAQANNFGSLYSMVLPGKRKVGEPGVGGTAHPEEVMAYAKKHPDMGGVFLWTGFDYNGEPSPFTWPAVSSQFGICDLCGFPKDYYYYYQAQWTQKPMIHLMPHWNEAGLEIDGQGKTLVKVFTNQSEAELFINGISQGRKTVTDYQAQWVVTYQAGSLEAKGYDKQGAPVVTTKVQTASTPVAISSEVVYRGQKYDLVALVAKDQAGNVVPTANQEVNLKVTSAKIVGLGNGDPADISNYALDKVKLFMGKALAVVKKEPKVSYQVEVEF